MCIKCLIYKSNFISTIVFSLDSFVGATATALSVTASVTDNGTLSYQWYSNMFNDNTGGSIAFAGQA
jgi:hypothetical protein